MSSPLDYGTFVVPPPPPPLPLGRRWWWFTMGVTILSLGIATTSAVLIGMWATRDYPDLVDDSRILSVIDTECDRMTQSVTDLTPRGNPRQVAQAIVAQDMAVQDMLDAVKSLDPDLLRSDQPTLAWIADWQRFIDAREELSLELNAGRRPGLAPLNDSKGNSIFERMEYAVQDCPIPDTLLDPYPSPSENDV